MKKILFEDWSSAGKRSAIRATSGSFVLAILLIFFGVFWMITTIVVATSGQGGVLQASVYAAVCIGSGAGLIVCCGHMLNDVRAAAIIVLFITILIVSIQVAALIPWVLEIGTRGGKVIDFSFLGLLGSFGNIVMFLSGSWSFWFTLRTLQEWPGKRGEAFEVVQRVDVEEREI